MYLGPDKNSNIFAFLGGMILAIFIISYLVVIIARKFDKNYDATGEVFVIYMWFGVALIIMCNYLIMMVLKYSYKPITLDVWGMFIAGSVTSVILIIILGSYATVIYKSNISQDDWRTKLFFPLILIVQLISFAILYYFFS
jgi:small-conductance mechanosensitive channel